MVELKISIPEELEELSSVSKVDWQLAIAKKLKKEFEEISKVKSIVSKSELTQEQADELSNEVNLALVKRYEKK